MKPIPKPLVWGLRGILVLPLLGMLGWSQWNNFKRTRVISCTNHGHHLEMAMLVLAHEDETWRLPHIAGADGCQMLVGFTLAEFGPTGGRLNCHHGASGHREGGWQSLNLAPAKWEEVLSRWEKQNPFANGTGEAVPLFWCGRPTGTGDRVIAGVRRGPEGRLWLSIGRLPEDKIASQLAWLNQQLIELRESPVPLNIPSDVDWPAVIKWAEGVTNSFSKRRP